MWPTAAPLAGPSLGLWLLWGCWQEICLLSLRTGLISSQVPSQRWPALPAKEGIPQERTKGTLAPPPPTSTHTYLHSQCQQGLQIISQLCTLSHARATTNCSHPHRLPQALHWSPASMSLPLQRETNLPKVQTLGSASHLPYEQRQASSLPGPPFPHLQGRSGSTAVVLKSLQSHQTPNLI